MRKVEATTTVMMGDAAVTYVQFAWYEPWRVRIVRSEFDDETNIDRSCYSMAVAVGDADRWVLWDEKE